MQIGDLVRFNLDRSDECAKSFRKAKGWSVPCACWFCFNDSSCVGIIVNQGDNVEFVNDEGLTVHTLEWSVLFDAGIYEVYGVEVEVING
jgi:hypothetical protein